MDVDFLDVTTQERLPLAEMAALDEDLLLVKGFYPVEERILSALSKQSRPTLAYEGSPLCSEGLSLRVRQPA